MSYCEWIDTFCHGKLETQKEKELYWDDPHCCRLCHKMRDQLFEFEADRTFI